MHLRSEETGKKAMGAVYLNHIFYHYMVSRLSGMLHGVHRRYGTTHLTDASEKDPTILTNACTKDPTGVLETI